MSTTDFKYTMNTIDISLFPNLKNGNNITIIIGQTNYIIHKGLIPVPGTVYGSSPYFYEDNEVAPYLE